MMQATIAIYPLGQADDAAVDDAIDRLRAAGVVTEVRPIYTEVGATRRPSSVPSMVHIERRRPMVTWS